MANQTAKSTEAEGFLFLKAIFAVVGVASLFFAGFRLKSNLEGAENAFEGYGRAAYVLALAVPFVVLVSLIFFRRWSLLPLFLMLVGIWVFGVLSFFWLFSPPPLLANARVCLAAIKSDNLFKKRSIVEADRLLLDLRQCFPGESDLVGRCCDDHFNIVLHRAKEASDPKESVASLRELEGMQFLESFQSVLSDNADAIAFYNLDLPAFKDLEKIEISIADCIRQGDKFNVERTIEQLTGTLDRLRGSSPCRLLYTRLLDDLHLYKLADSVEKPAK